jgi:hypothetical protein
MASTDFYSAAAQIIPVMFIAGLVEARLWRNGDDPTGELFALGILVAGEGGALFALATNTSSRSVSALVGLAIVISGAALTWPLIKPRHDAAREKAGAGGSPRRVDLAWLYVVLVFSVGTLVIAGVLLVVTLIVAGL